MVEQKLQEADMAKGVSAPDNTAQLAELERQKKAAQENADRLAAANLEDVNATRRRARGKSVLTATSEFGTGAPLGK